MRRDPLIPFCHKGLFFADSLKINVNFRAFNGENDIRRRDNTEIFL